MSGFSEFSTRNLCSINTINGLVNLKKLGDLAWHCCRLLANNPPSIKDSVHQELL